VGKNGRLSDGGVIEYTEFYKRLKSGRLNLPTSMETRNLNFIFLGDEAFSLSKNLRPFPQKDLTYEKRIYYRLSRARNVSENAFGLVNSRFRILNTCINMAPEKVRYIVLAICALHNCLMKQTSSYVKSIFFWDMTPCSALNGTRRFGGTYRLHLQGRRIVQRSSEQASTTQRTTRRHIQEEDILQNHRCENLKSYKLTQKFQKSWFTM
jgi:hypothetical protein